MKNLSDYQKQQYTKYLQTQLENFSIFMLNQKKQNEKYKLWESTIINQNQKIIELTNKVNLIENYQHETFNNQDRIRLSMGKVQDIQGRIRKLQNNFRSYNPTKELQSQNNIKPNNQQLQNIEHNLIKQIKSIEITLEKRIKKLQKQFNYEKNNSPLPTNHSQVSYIDNDKVSKKDLKKVQKKLQQYFNDNFNRIEQIINKSINKNVGIKKKNKQNKQNLLNNINVLTIQQPYRSHLSQKQTISIIQKPSNNLSINELDERISSYFIEKRKKNKSKSMKSKLSYDDKKSRQKCKSKSISKSKSRSISKSISKNNISSVSLTKSKKSKQSKSPKINKHNHNNKSPKSKQIRSSKNQSNQYKLLCKKKH